MKTSHRIVLDGDAWLLHWNRLLCNQSDGLLEALVDALAWQQPSVTLYGKRHRLPRLQCWMGDANARYRYSGLLLEPESWHPVIQDVRCAVEKATGCAFNSVLINLYRDGEDRMGWHADDEPELGPEPWVASYSLGASRDFVLRRKGETRQRHKVSLSDDSLLLMSPSVQHGWQHSVPARRGVKSPRINLTFRLIQ